MSGAGASTSISTSPSPGELLGKITEHATKAVSADAGGRYSSALCSYNDALKAMLRAAGKGAVEGRQPVALGAKFGEYADRASQLLRQLANKPSHGGDLEHAQSALRGARLAQRRGQTDAALGLYIDGIGSYQKVLQQERAAGGDWVRELRRFANLCLSEAESVKAGNGNGAGGGSASDGGPDSDSDSDSDSDANADAQLLTREEAAVVRRTSLVNGLTFLPWVRGDSGEAFGGAVFSDKDGLPALSAKQQRRLVRWRRAGLAAGCTMFAQAGCEHIVQEMVTDCSFVAALCASVEHERRFSRQVVTRHVYPRRRGQAAVSGSGKYLVKLFVNGLWRRVVIDDRLPAGAGGRLLCTYSTRGDIGPSLLEKAFLKVMGGYDFPGSNSSTDLHVLTGWVPEHVFVHDAGFDAGATWARLADGARRGTVLATIATGEIGATAAGALGLVPAHAYAVLDVRE
ncbi:cysteine protease, partial [Kickxella alabastrina]